MAGGRKKVFASAKLQKEQTAHIFIMSTTWPLHVGVDQLSSLTTAMKICSYSADQLKTYPYWQSHVKARQYHITSAQSQSLTGKWNKHFATAHKEEEMAAKDLPWTLRETISGLQSRRTSPGDGITTSLICFTDWVSSAHTALSELFWFYPSQTLENAMQPGPQLPKDTDGSYESHHHSIFVLSGCYFKVLRK